MGIAPTIGGRVGEILLPKALGLKAWTLHPVGATLAATQANTHLAAVYLDAGDVITYLSVPVTVAGASVTIGVLGVYDASLNLVATTANSPASFQAAGWIELALTTPYVVPSAGLYFLASGFAASGSLPTVLNEQHTQPNSVTTLPGGKYLGVHAQVPVSNVLPNPAVSQGSFTNVPLIVAR